MARRKPQVPGATGAATDSPSPVTPPARRPRRAGRVDPGASAPAEALPPKIVEAVASATHMSVEQAQELDGKGQLTGRVLTPQGWYIPKSTEQVG